MTTDNTRKNKTSSTAVGHHKKYSKILGMWDVISRGRMRAVFGSSIKDNDDVYGVDFMINEPKCRYTQLEIQVVKKWREGQEYPYPNITIFTRKGRYDEKTLFCSLNRELTECYLFYLSEADRETPTPLFPESKEYVYSISWQNATKLFLHTVDGSILSRLYPIR
jgi:hypothetical protein